MEKKKTEIEKGIIEGYIEFDSEKSRDILNWYQFELASKTDPEFKKFFIHKFIEMDGDDGEEEED